MANHIHEDVARQLSYSRRQRLDLFRRIRAAEQGVVLLKLSPKVQAYILDRLSDEELVGLLNFLDSQQTTKLLRHVPQDRADELLSQLSDSVRTKAEYLLRFDPRAAAGLMNLNYVAVQEDSTFRDVSQVLQTEEHNTGLFPTILVLDGAKLVGELSGHELVLSRPSQHILPHVKHIPMLPYDSSEQAVATAFLHHPHGKIVVTDKDKAIIGVINTDDIIPLLRDHTGSGLYKFAGVVRDEDAYDGPLVKVKYRYKWLIINLGTAFLAASVVGMFESTISKFVLLAIYMPIVAGMGGNAGTQTLAVAIRALTLKEVDLKTARPFIINEMIAGGINGLINGAIVAAVAVFFNHSPMLGVVLALAMIINLVIAGLAGATIPLVMKKLGKDPASSATIFITTATDVCGFFVFLGLASILLG